MEKDVRKRERLQFLYWYKTGQATTRKALGKLLHRSQFAIGRWIDTYREKGLAGLLKLNDRGGNLSPSIPIEIQAQLKEKLAQPEGFASYEAIQVWFKETHGLDVPYSTVFGTVNYRLNASLRSCLKTKILNLNNFFCKIWVKVGYELKNYFKRKNLMRGDLCHGQKKFLLKGTQAI